MKVRLRVKELARAKKMSQGELGRRANIDPKTMRKIFRDPFAITTTETLAKLADVLGVGASELIESVPDDWQEPS